MSGFLFPTIQVAEKRKRDIGAFLQGLFRLSDEISHSDLVYTFFHPLHRDQKEANIHINKLKGKHISLLNLLATDINTLSSRTQEPPEEAECRTNLREDQAVRLLQGGHSLRSGSSH